MEMRTATSRLLPAAVAVGAVLALAGPAGAQADPPGNNGTVKIDGVDFDDHPNNEPHVGCEFQVDFYGFDEGEDLEATVTFEAIAPTEGEDDEPLLDDTVAIGDDPAEGGTDLDASETYDLTDELSAIEPHPQQGWHVRLTVHADGSQGADTKHKVFWVSGCEPTTSTSSSTTSTSTPGSTSSSVPGSTTSTVPGSTTSTVPGTHPSTPSTSAGPGGSTPSTGVSPDAPTTVPASAEGDLPRTGSTTVPLVIGAGALMALGLGGVAAARYLRSASA